MRIIAKFVLFFENVGFGGSEVELLCELVREDDKLVWHVLSRNQRLQPICSIHKKLKSVEIVIKDDFFDYSEEEFKLAMIKNEDSSSIL